PSSGCRCRSASRPARSVRGSGTSSGAADDCGRGGRGPLPSRWRSWSKRESARMARATCSWSLSVACACGPPGGLEKRSFCDRMAGEEIVMIELTEEQRRAIATTDEEPPTVIDPTTRATYVLLRRELYERWKGI